MLNRISLLCVGFLAALSCASGAKAQEKVTFASGTRSVSYVTYYAAQEMGYFNDVGLQPEMILAGSGPKAMAAVASGDVDVVIRAPSEIIKARENGLDVKIFGALVMEMGANVVFSKKWAEAHQITADSPSDQKLKALKGIRLAINGPGSITDAVARYFVGRAGLDPDRDATLVSIPNQSGSMMLAMQQGRIDGFVVSSPDTDIAVKDQGAVIVFNNSAGKVPELAGYFYIGLGASGKFLKTEKARKVARGFQMTLDAIQDPARTDIVRDKVRASQFANVPADVFAAVWKNVVIASPKKLEMNDGMFEKIAMLEKVLSSQINMATAHASYINDLADAARQ
jgi:NitT/TauT family transport system substrate-binding protein